jgi:deoxyribonuclease-4
MMRLGCHVGMAGPDFVLGSVREALGYGANALMLYTGAPQNTRRVPVEQLKIPEAVALWTGQGYRMEDIVVHMPYLINLANTVKPETRESGMQLLGSELDRSRAIGARYAVLHPGAAVGGDPEAALAAVAGALNAVLPAHPGVMVCLETMAGKGSEVGRSLEQLRQILDLLDDPDAVGICLDTCHLSDGGYDVGDADGLLRQFDAVLGLEKLKVVHLNDSKNERGSRKDRHTNIGAGTIGFAPLYRFAHDPRLDDKPVILETPYVDQQPPYQKEIRMLRSGTFEPWD